ncbi:MAG TPA: very short patch repair endonuclease [Verrucomicrobiae bacterium]
MADVFSAAKRSRVMAAVRSTGNKETELRLAALLRQHRITGWRRNYPLFGKPDFVFREQRVAIFVDGCFWHGCRRHCRMPENNRKYWQSKIARNSVRDRLTNRRLRSAGWKVIRIWGHSLASPHRVLARINSVLSEPRGLCDDGRR